MLAINNIDNRNYDEEKIYCDVVLVSNRYEKIYSLNLKRNETFDLTQIFI